MQIRNRQEFEAVYADCVSEVIARMPEDWSAFSRHNAGWRKGRFDAEDYLRSSVERYWRAYRLIAADGARDVLDVGGFLAAFPLALQRVGFNVALAERFAYYGTGIDAIANHVRRSGVTVIDADFTDTVESIDTLAGRYSAVTCMAVAEHLAHSPRLLLENIARVLGPGGTFVFEVPNLAFWPKRFAFLVRGASVLAPIEDVYHSAVPFTGHHREYTLADARYVLTEAGFDIARSEGFNYGFDRRRWFNRLKYAPALLFDTWSEVLLLHCRKPPARAVSA